MKKLLFGLLVVGFCFSSYSHDIRTWIYARNEIQGSMIKTTSNDRVIIQTQTGEVSLARWLLSNGDKEYLNSIADLFAPNDTSFDQIISRDIGRPSYEFKFIDNDDGGFYLLYLMYQTPPSPQEAEKTSCSMIKYVIEKYSPREILLMVWEAKDDPFNIFDGHNSLFWNETNKKIMTSKEKSEYKMSTNEDEGVHIVKEVSNDVYGRKMISLEFYFKVNRKENEIVEIMMHKLSNEIKATEGKIGICSARAYDGKNISIDGCYIEFSPEKQSFNRVWFKTNGHDFKIQPLGALK